MFQLEFYAKHDLALDCKVLSNNFLYETNYE